MNLERTNAIEHLERSREEIRQTFLMPEKSSAQRESDTGLRSLAPPSWVDLLLLLPVPHCLKSVLQLWMSSQPIRDAVSIANNAAHLKLSPIAQRRPWTLVLSAAVVGGVIVKTPAWGWLFNRSVAYSVQPSKNKNHKFP